MKYMPTRIFFLLQFPEFARVKLIPIVYFFSSVAYVLVPGAKTTGPIVKKFGFS
jgi:hypothetical protein